MSSDWQSTDKPWTGRQIFTACVLCLIIGIEIGVLVW